MLEEVTLLPTGDADWCRWGESVRELTSATRSSGACESPDGLAPTHQGAPRDARRHQPAVPSPSRSMDSVSKPPTKDPPLAPFLRG